MRFDAAWRLVHWATAALVLVLFATGAILYVPALGRATGHRLAVEDIHVWAGIAVTVPLAAALAGPWGRRLRSDLRAMDRLTAEELLWLRSLGRRATGSVGKFNPGQKLNTFAVGGLLTTLLVTGLILRWGNFLAVSARTGATFVHDVCAVAIVGLVAGHVVMAVTHPGALRSMVTGRVDRRWIARHAPAWQPDEPGPRARGARRRPGREARLRGPDGSGAVGVAPGPVTGSSAPAR